MLNVLEPVSRWIVEETVKSINNEYNPTDFIKSSRAVLFQLLSLLLMLIKDNVYNQVYIADYLLIVLAHVSTDYTAADVAQELLRGSKNMEDSKIGVKEVTLFAEKMGSLPN